jgi:uncharacterized MnhB-related membrane protein
LRALVVGTLAAAVVAAAIAYAVVFAVDRSAAWSVWLGLPIILVAAAVSLTFVGLQGRQTIIAWPSKWLAASGIRAGATLLFAALAYVLFNPPPVAYALSLLGGYIAVLIVETALFTMALNRTWKAETSSTKTTETEEPS